MKHLLLFLAMLVLPARLDAQLTARAVVERIKQNMGVRWLDTTVDTFKDGDPDARVTGIAVTMMATLDVLHRAAEAGHNLIITHEPTFYGHLDRLDQLEAASDPVTAAKRAFIKEHGLIIWRSHDHWHRRNPDGVQVGMLRALGWQTPSPGDSLVTIPATTLAELATGIERRLGAARLSYVGDPKLIVSKLALAPGFQGFARHLRLLQRADVEVLIIGEANEWETMPYVADAQHAGMKKALVVIGHIPSEQAGMEEFARWLKGFVTEVPVSFIENREAASARVSKE